MSEPRTLIDRLWAAHEIVRREDGAALGSCPCRKSNPDILMMQPAQNRTAKNVTDGPYDARYGRILL